jgi:putative adhesin
VGANRVDVHLNRGRVEVSGGPFDDIDVEASEGVQVQRNHDRVRVNGNDGDCVVYAPPGTRVDIHANRAEVNVLGVASVSIHVNEGDIDVADVDGKLDIHANSLELAVDNVAGPIDVHANRGDVFMRVAPGERVRADLRTEKGDVSNSVPSGSDVVVKVRINRGDITLVDDAR